MCRVLVELEGIYEGLGFGTWREDGPSPLRDSNYSLAYVYLSCNSSTAIHFEMMVMLSDTNPLLDI